MITALAPSGAAERLNRGCFCLTLDRSALAEELDREAGVRGFAEQLMGIHPTLFSNVPVFVPSTVLDEMKLIIDAIDAASRLPGYRAAALAMASQIAVRDFGPVGAVMGYDFHITPEGPRLIEVNTNAGGAFLNAVLARSQRACCATSVRSESEPAAGFDTQMARMFVDEWRSQRGTGEPALIAIVDDAPDQQHLYPEFQLAQALLERQGMETVIADAAELTFNRGGLAVGGRSIDLVYNRLVDFGLDEPRHAALRAAYCGGRVVVTPNPHVHALFADKRNLALLSDATRLKDWGLTPGALVALESGVPKTQVVSASNAEDLWNGRRGLFFKPARGHGSRAAYRGDKITQRVWAEITTGEYVAQAYAAPALRGVAQAAGRAELKVDIRLYTYAGSLMLAAARLYQGQTTNMRTLSGGFAPVLVVREAAAFPLALPDDGVDSGPPAPCH